MTSDANALGRILDNPFYVLGVRPHATPKEVEREGQKLLGMLELGLKSASTYATPVGARARTADLVRTALAELRDPERRLVHELWARLEPGILEPDEIGEEASTRADAPWTEALSAFGWER